MSNSQKSSSEDEVIIQYSSSYEDEIIPTTPPNKFSLEDIRAECTPFYTPVAPKLEKNFDDSEEDHEIIPRRIDFNSQKIYNLRTEDNFFQSDDPFLVNEKKSIEVDEISDTSSVSNDVGDGMNLYIFFLSIFFLSFMFYFFLKYWDVKNEEENEL